MPALAPGKRTNPPRSTEPGISGAIVGPVLQALASLGLDLGTLGAVEPSSEEIVPGALADRWLEDAAARLDDEAIGITLASRIPIGVLGLLDYALCTSGDLRNALERVAAHYGVATQRVELTLVEAPPRAALVLERRPGMVHSRHWIEFSFAILGQRMRQTIGREIEFDEVAFRHPPPATAAAHDAFFGIPVQFGAPEDRLGFAHALLATPLRTAAASLAEVLDAKMRELDAGVGAPDTLVARVRRVVCALLDERDVRLQAAASRLHMSARTLQRELGRQGTSHKELLDAIRRERALALLVEGNGTVADIAARLGYTEPSAFFRAFRRWTGKTPRAER